MMTIWRRTAVLFLIALVACSAPTAQQKRHARERLLLNPIEVKYNGIITGFDFQGALVDVSVDLEQLQSMDVDREDRMKAEMLRRWRTTWIATHPHRHATVTVRFIDFRGNEESQESTRA
jgi:hypothetical protein